MDVKRNNKVQFSGNIYCIYITVVYFFEGMICRRKEYEI